MAARFEIKVNGERVCVSGLEDDGVLTAIVNFVKHADEEGQYDLSTSALDDSFHLMITRIMRTGQFQKSLLATKSRFASSLTASLILHKIFTSTRVHRLTTNRAPNNDRLILGRRAERIREKPPRAIRTAAERPAQT